MSAVVAVVAAILKTLVRDWRAWAAAVIGGLMLHGWVLSAQLDAARKTSAAREETVAALRGRLATAEAGRLAAQAGKSRAEAALGEYARATFDAFNAQVEASRQMAAQLAEANRRLNAAQQEIARADGSLRLDDPLPRGLRDALACAGGDAGACAGATQTDPAGVPSGAAEPAGPARAAARGDDGA